MRLMPAATADYLEGTRAASEMVAKVALADKLNAYPDELSGGRQQGVAIARSLAMRTKVTLFDGIASALDPELVGEVPTVLDNLARGGMTMLLVCCRPRQNPVRPRQDRLRLTVSRWRRT